MLGATFLPDRLRAGGGGGSAGDDGAGVACGDDGGVTKLSSKSVGRVGAGGISGGGDAGGAGTSGATLSVTGGVGGCAGCDTAVDGGDGPGSGGVTEENLRKNCRFLSVTRPLPSILILYLLYPRSSITVPDLSHFLAILPAPCWFCTRTFWPRLRGARFLVCSVHCSSPLANLDFMASSLFSLQSTQTSEGEKFPGLMGRKSLIGRPNTS